MTIYGRIYGLHDPVTDELRYIGQTVVSLTRRLGMHCAPSVLAAERSHRAHWVEALLRQGLRPVIREIATASSKEELDLLEVEHIAMARACKVRLVNTEPGGATHSLEHYERLAAAKRGVPRTPEVRAKISAARKGQPSPKRGIPISEEQKAKVSASRKGQLLGSTHHQYRHDISTAFILQRLAEGRTRVQVAAELGVSPTFIHRRLNQEGLKGSKRPKVKRTAWNKGKPHSSEHVNNWKASRWGSEAAA